MILQQALAQSHEYAKKVVREGDTVIDATCGNGHDTLFLAGLVGDSGKVYAFDIQKEALGITRKRLLENGMLHRCFLIPDGHQNMHRYVNQPVKLVLFNLGYRPGGDHSICTRGETTIKAVETALNLLVVHGLIVLVIYHGGDTGFEERDYLLKALPDLNPKKAAVMMTSFINLPNNPPILVCIEKLG
ncbi:putative rRNA methylase [Thermoclostridium stercorarium subsp. stercorarium DSM 8532]|jgi:SAM-dependent methyltransferase|uniref:SAM-dependent methyltransferase n=3 Tax=Thermoclostridium stercorarium TaxID=1510 RepID=A0A1B1YJP6_THEST|nr:class I SAM-dependent methyltransferase [Thermoclostridium stercorarium]AGC68094.1 putative rRNA methylase [Thermoclostridium stercorarium subsp. stercorarium DSM 8532]AGI39120.1 methylase [Thermoclostridium stercorarium subsp. stercorarium DSM 8532]ANW98476.1 SAM-dependent methyltransferase [Thermoclostridium stercorarium subsp. thermolacticum DSM 2910]ANX01009.1 SAM-dependent methyltransferase [Thermoclostridium stercorarium subsp. leptospartum DSM 9219]UZQ86622.1 class I SAM-dependent me